MGMKTSYDQKTMSFRNSFKTPPKLLRQNAGLLVDFPLLAKFGNCPFDELKKNSTGFQIISTTSNF